MSNVSQIISNFNPIFMGCELNNTHTAPCVCVRLEPQLEKLCGQGAWLPRFKFYYESPHT